MPELAWFAPQTWPRVSQTNFLFLFMAANQVDGIFTSHCLKLALWRLPDGPDVIDLIEFVIVRCNYSPLYSPPPSVRYECGVNTSVSGQKCFDKSENIAGIRPASESSGGSAA